MITMIINLIFKLFTFLGSAIINLVMLAFPNMELDRLTGAFTTFYGIIGNSMQMTYFIFGPMTYIFADIIILLFTLRHVVLPVVNFTRKVIIK